MPTANLNLRTELTFEEDPHFKLIEVGQILVALNRQFPQGFYAKAATKFLRGTFGDLPHEFRTSYNQFATAFLYIELANLGYLEQVNKDTKSPFGGKHFYRCKPELLNGYESPEPPARYIKRTLEFPDGLLSLMLSYSRFLDIPPDQASREALEGRILGDEGFLTFLERTKKVSPKLYESMGGEYLDNLLRGRPSQRQLNFQNPPDHNI